MTLYLNRSNRETRVRFEKKEA